MEWETVGIQLKKTKMKVQIRKIEVYQVHTTSEVQELDIDNLKKCTPKYEGVGAQDVVEFLANEIYDIDSFIDENEAVLSEENKNALYELYNCENGMTEIYDSRTKGAEYLYQVGKLNPQMTKTGGFEVEASS